MVATPTKGLGNGAEVAVRSTSDFFRRGVDPGMRPTVALAFAILSEVAGTAALKASDGFTAPPASLAVVVGYGSAFYLLSRALEDLSVGFVYATWSGAGIVGAALVGVVLFDEGVDLAAVVGMTLVVAGVTVLAGFSSAYSPAH